MLMWCLTDTDYGQPMKWGLWRFRDEGWEPRPGFYSWSLITRYTEIGSSVHPLKTNAEDAAGVAFRAPTNMDTNGGQPQEDRPPFTAAGLPPKSAGSRSCTALSPSLHRTAG